MPSRRDSQEVGVCKACVLVLHTDTSFTPMQLLLPPSLIDFVIVSMIQRKSLLVHVREIDASKQAIDKLIEVILYILYIYIYIYLAYNIYNMYPIVHILVYI